MAAFQTMSRADEQKLASAIESAADRILAGEHPTDAVVKAADGRGFPPPQLKLMTSAVNTGQANAQRLRGETTLEKAAAVPLADYAAVLERLYPEPVLRGQARAVKKAAAVSAEYAAAPSWFGQRLHQAKLAAAQALLPKAEKKAAPTVVRSERERQVDASNLFNRLRREREETEVQLSLHLKKASTTLKSLEDYFALGNSLSLADVRANCAALWGKQAELALATIPEQHGWRPSKSASDRLTVDQTKAPYKEVKRLLELADEHARVKEAHTYAEQRWTEVRRATVPVAYASEKSSQELSAPTSVLSGLGKSAGIGGLGLLALTLSQQGKYSPGVVGEIARRYPSALRSKAEMEEDDYRRLTNPEHERDIAHIRGEALLNDLLANDEVIRGYHPAAVVDSFNEVTELTGGSHQRAIIRDLMRRRLAQGPQALDQFVTQNALSSQKTLKEINSPDRSTMDALMNSGVLPRAGQQAPPQQPPRRM